MTETTTETETLSWIQRLKALAEAGELDENSLDPARLLNISNNKVNKLKKLSRANTRKASASQSSDPLLSEERSGDKKVRSVIESVGNNGVCFRYASKRKLNKKTEEKIVGELKKMVSKEVDETSGWLFVFNFCGDEIDSSKAFVDNKQVVFHFPMEELKTKSVDIGGKKKKVPFAERTFPSSWTPVDTTDTATIAYASSSGEVGVLVNPFVKKSASKFSFSAAAATSIGLVLGPLVSEASKKYRTSENSGSNNTDTEMIQAIEDIEILKLLFGHVANDSVREYNKTLEETEAAKTSVRTGVDTMLVDNSKNKQLQGQIEALRQTAEETGVNFDNEIASLEEKLVKSADAKSRQVQKVKNNISRQKELGNRIDLLRKEMAGYRGQQLVRSLTELTRIRENHCVAAARLKEKKSALWLDIVLHPVVMENDRTRFLIDQMHFQIAISSSNHIKMNWLWDKDALTSPHPHVSAAGGTCWGEASSPISDALSRNELSTVIRYITGWASQYNPASPYVALLRSNFPTTNLPVGWHPELTDLSLAE